jgi:hypothetical protein
MLTECVKCGTELSVPETGRPPRYCSKGCRRAAEYEIRRLQRHLEDLELRERSWRQDADGVGISHGGGKGRIEKHLEWHRAEIARVERRVRDLLEPEEVDR